MTPRGAQTREPSPKRGRPEPEPGGAGLQEGQAWPTCERLSDATQRPADVVAKPWASDSGTARPLAQRRAPASATPSWKPGIWSGGDEKVAPAGRALRRVQMPDAAYWAATVEL